VKARVEGYENKVVEVGITMPVMFEKVEDEGLYERIFASGSDRLTQHDTFAFPIPYGLARPQWNRPEFVPHGW